MKNFKFLIHLILVIGLETIRIILKPIGYKVLHKKQFDNALKFSEISARNKAWEDFSMNYKEIFWHIRDFTHNLPEYLNFETEEEQSFCTSVLQLLPKSVYPAYGRLLFELSDFDIDRAGIDKIRKKYTKETNGFSLTNQDFEQVLNGDYLAAMHITDVIFHKNLFNFTHNLKKANNPAPGRIMLENSDWSLIEPTKNKNLNWQNLDNEPAEWKPA